MNAERLTADSLGIRAPDRVEVKAAGPDPGREMPVEGALEELRRCIPTIARIVELREIKAPDELRRDVLALLAAIDAHLPLSAASARRTRA